MTKRDNSTPSPLPQLVGGEIEKAISLGAAVLTRIEDPAVREVAIRNALTVASTMNVVGLPQDVIDLVIAAREAFDTGMLPDDENRTLDKALNAFSSRVPYDNEPDVWP